MSASTRYTQSWISKKIDKEGCCIPEVGVVAASKRWRWSLRYYTGESVLYSLPCSCILIKGLISIGQTFLQQYFWPSVSTIPGCSQNCCFHREHFLLLSMFCNLVVRNRSKLPCSSSRHETFSCQVALPVNMMKKQVPAKAMLGQQLHCFSFLKIYQ